MTAPSKPPTRSRRPGTSDSQVYTVSTNDMTRQAHILQRRAGEVYVHYLNTDKRLDEWVPDSACVEARQEAQAQAQAVHKRRVSLRSAGRSTSVSPARPPTPGPSSRQITGPDATLPLADPPTMTEEDFDIHHHKQITAQRNFDKVNFGKWQMKTWYFSPYPLTEAEAEDSALAQGPSSATQAPKIPGVTRTTLRSHGRTSDLLAGGLGRTHGAGEKATLWVCDRCFKYMADGISWELHIKHCDRNHPPGRKVYQRGAHTIWEVDGAKDKLFCQNLSLFGKLFIDIKTLFFDCDNFLFYILTDASARRDHVLGFFSKEKVSYDDYNLACIITLPPYQRKGYGMLMIEFSYELSRRAGKIGTPERPLSDLGLRSYLSYWVSTLVRFLRRLLSVVPPESQQIVSRGIANFVDLRSPLQDAVAIENGTPRPRKKKFKGWDGEASGMQAIAPLCSTDDRLFTSLRMIHTTANEDGSATSHVIVRCTLADLARATNLRVDDAAFALNECGMLDRRGLNGEGNKGEKAMEVIAITRDMVEKVARERKVKMMYVDLAHVLL